MASTKININQGMDIFAVLSRNMNIVAMASGIIHRARVSLVISVSSLFVVLETV